MGLLRVTIIMAEKTEITPSTMKRINSRFCKICQMA